ncbi:hypothetical protein FJW05_03460 [Mesorhizobium sp. B2-9-1]|uniref:hypothetical protein n=1 Tax=unclassified Mesorhizobium TaxID=325217 RepID=UPI00112B2C42|nr:MULTISPECIES: hypothetical protein [unclassified Mesorhizobium]TPI50130.1 hypothetical protein FJW05_03460 [Mesorhizobium sp. B2-9-1]TPJ31769.1 hypothetical protein FJ425_02515 [Mesorhizobium sp. B2-7-2]
MHSRNIDEIVRSFGRLLNPNSRARDRASACTIEDRPFDRSAVLEKWQNGPRDTQAEYPRSVAYLAAYAMIFGEGINPEGVLTDDGRWFRPDHSVIRALIRSRDLILNVDAEPMLRLADAAYGRIAAALNTAAQE